MCEMQSDCFASHLAPVIDGTSLRFVPYYELLPSIVFDAQFKKEVPFTTPSQTPEPLLDICLQRRA